jgi:hypothetical protein
MKGKANKFDKWRVSYGTSWRRVALAIIVGVLLIMLGGLYWIVGDAIIIGVVLITLGLLVIVAAACVATI